MTFYKLPDLKYDYNALEPYISAKIMELHHSKHHKAYVDGANKALNQLEESRSNNNLENVNKFQKDLAFNLSGHINHTIFWNNISPSGGGHPQGALRLSIDKHFESFENFKNHFTASSLGIQGSGWSMLAWDPLGKTLIIEQIFDHQSSMITGVLPLLVLDMWEHAFYMDYKNIKIDYINAFWNIVDWSDVQERFSKATREFIL